MGDTIINFIATTLRLSTPLIFASCSANETILALLSSTSALTISIVVLFCAICAKTSVKELLTFLF